MFLDICKDHPSVMVRNNEGVCAGFGMLRPHNPMPAFSHTAEITYFIRPELTGKGLGSQMLEYLVTDGKKRGISNVLEAFPTYRSSIRFHQKNCSLMRQIQESRR
jgi:phosphinothricin acetyltransferase